MTFLTRFCKASSVWLLLGASLFASANNGLISPEASNVVHTSVGKTNGARNKQLAILQSYLLTNSVTVGLDPSDASDWKAASISRGIGVWTDALSDCPFVLAKAGQRPMIVVKFVDSIESGGDVQGQVEATRFLHWGTSASYRIEGSLLVRRMSGRHELREDELTEVVAHELGHLLGLDDAEECVGLMGPFVPGRPRMKPSANELGAVIDFRNQLRDAIAKLNNR